MRGSPASWAGPGAVLLTALLLLAAAAAAPAHAAQAAPSLASAPAAPVAPVAPAARPKTCLVLSGGGARGVAHIGVLKVLEELHVPIDCVVGTSAGAIVGGAYAVGVTPQVMEDRIRSADWERILTDQPARVDRSVRSKFLDREHIAPLELGLRGGETVLPLGAVSGQQLDGFLRSLVGLPVDVKFDSLPIPFRAISTDISNGKMVVIDHGSVVGAMRASMSVPAIFSPQWIDGTMLVDGGLVRNLGVDVARSMGAERIIAVNLGTPLLKPEQVQSLVRVTEQMIAILTEQNVERSLGELREGDVLISPELGEFSATDFQHSASNIVIGEQATRAAAARLAALAVPAQAYAAWRASRGTYAVPKLFADIRVDTESLKHVDPASVEAVFRAAQVKSAGEAGLVRGVNALYATDDFEQVSLRVDEVAGGAPVLVLEPREKRWGPNYLRFGLALSTDLAGKSAFDVLADYRATWLNSRGLEWRTTASIGDQTGLSTELLQPFDAERRWFTALDADFSQELDDFFVGNTSVAQLRSRRAAGELDVGRYIGTFGELRFGYQAERLSTYQTTGTGIPNSIDDVGALHGSVVIDRLDRWDFAQSGWYASLDVKLADPAFGGDHSFTKVLLEADQAFGTGRHSFLLGARYGNAFNSHLPFGENFALGGFLDGSGLEPRQLLGSAVTFGRGIYTYRLGGDAGVVQRWYVGGSLEAGRVTDRSNSLDRVNFRVFSSVFIAADTALGPFYFGAGFAGNGQTALFLSLGGVR